MPKRRVRLMRGFRPSIFAWIILFAGLLCTAVSSALMRRAVVRYDRLRFNLLSVEVSDEVRTRMEAYTAALLQTKAFFEASNGVSRKQFHAYVEAGGLMSRFPGALGLGFAIRVHPFELQRHEHEIRASGFPNYKVWPKGPRADYYSILYIEPFNWRNQRAFGFDMFTEPRRRSAMERARDTGLPAITDPVTLVQETGDHQQRGFLIYVPVYRPGTSPRSVEERRKDLVGFVYAPFRAGDLFNSILQGFFQHPIPIRFEVFDSNKTDPGSLLYRYAESAPHISSQAFRSTEKYFLGQSPSLVRRLSIQVAGHPWTLLLHPTHQFEEPITGWLPVLVGGMGVFLSVLLFRLKILNEQERHSRTVAETALRTREEFLSIASHELKTPLTPLKLQLEMVLRQLKKGREDFTPARVSRAVETSMRSLNRLSQLVDDLLDVSRIAHGKLQFEFECVNLSELVRDVIGRFGGELSDAGIPVMLDLDPATVCWCDRFRMEQVFVNLLTNAMKYGDGRPIEISVKRLPASFELRVRDHGPGIAREDQERIFGRFERVSSSTNIRGLGLGLYIVRMIVSAHGGVIRLTSQPGQGAEFVVELPVATGSCEWPGSKGSRVA